MDPTTAREILTRLIDGLDPETGQALPPDSILHRAGILRALLAAVSALKGRGARTARRAPLPSKVGRPWDPAEELALLELHRWGATVQEMARAHERTSRSIQLRLERLGVRGSIPVAASPSAPGAMSSFAANHPQ